MSAILKVGQGGPYLLMSTPQTPLSGHEHHRDLEAALLEIWAITGGDPEICVGIIDGAVDLSHESLQQARLTQVPPPNGAPAGPAADHGTHVASVIFGQPNGPVHGLAPDCRGFVVPLFADAKADGYGAVSQPRLAAAISAAVDLGAHVINVSAGDSTLDASLHPALAAALAKCAERGALVIAATGDGGCVTPQIPSAHSSVLAVASAAPKCAPMDDTSIVYDPGCILAPGDDILGAVPRGGVRPGTGTSFATAIVSGLVALLLSLQRRHSDHIDPARVGAVLLESATVVPGAGRLLDLHAALRLLQREYEDGVAQHVRSPMSSQLKFIDEALYAPSHEALRGKFGGVPADRFGTLTIHVPNRGEYQVAEFHYPLNDRRIGMRLVPVSDEDRISMPDGSSARGCDLLDAYLRREMDLSEEDPIFALLSYIHPEEHLCHVAELSQTAKIQLGHRHVGAYLGGGRTTQPLRRIERWRGESRVNMALNADRHPATVHLLSLEGVPQSVLNRNAHIVDVIVTDAARIPENAEDLIDCRITDLATTLQYYRDLLRGAAYLEDLPWYTNCSATQTVVVNLLLNVPHNRAAFAQIFGEDGADLWSIFMRRYEALTGAPFSEHDETAFTPLWELEGFSAETIQPLSLDQYYTYHAAREEGRLSTFTGRRPLEHNAGLAWPLETLVDLLGNFIATYAPFARVGGILVAAQVLLLRIPLASRIGLDVRTYLDAVAPVVAKILATEAVQRGRLGLAWLGRAGQELEWTVGRGLSERAGAGSQLDAAISRCVSEAAHEVTKLWKRGLPEQEATRSLVEAITADLDRLSAIVAPPGGRTGYFYGPSAFSQLALGSRPRSPFVRVQSACTVMDHNDLVLTG
jgi:hypothetical protein